MYLLVFIWHIEGVLYRRRQRRSVKYVCRIVLDFVLKVVHLFCERKLLSVGNLAFCSVLYLYSIVFGTPPCFEQFYIVSLQSTTELAI